MEGFIIALFVCLVLALISKYLSIPAIPFYILAGVILGKPVSGSYTRMRSVVSSLTWALFFCYSSWDLS
jgi:Kef-type K+ transport system membrane component KefB